MSTIYYYPEQSGLDILGVLEEDGLSYAFNTLAVFQHKATSRLFWAESEGCSCPSPFEEYHFNGPDDNDLHEVVDSTWMAFQNAVMDFPAEGADKHKLLRAALLALAQRGTMVFAGPILEGV